MAETPNNKAIYLLLTPKIIFASFDRQNRHGKLSFYNM